ncbi:MULTISPECIES: tyrosine-type recombinase/integrase [unclassified Microbacterium]|uniref:tyrosine-type recombinase/integrase n=1 Tax=unclassified Microbacterium TaxID=2609290 RepID=UPI003869C012
MQIVRETQERIKVTTGVGERPPDPFPRVTPYDLRHTAASLAISAGANVKAVQRMLGHASAAMTLDTYADLFDDDLDNVADALDRATENAGIGDVLNRG